MVIICFYQFLPIFVYMRKGRKLHDVNTDKEVLTACTFKCEPVLKFKMIENCRRDGLTLSEYIHTSLSMFEAQSDVRESYENRLEQMEELHQKEIERIKNEAFEKVKKIIEEGARNGNRFDERKMEALLSIWNK